MISKLPYAKQGYSGGKKLFDNTVGIWIPLKLLNGFTGEAYYMELPDMLIFKGYVVPGDTTQPMFELPSQYTITGTDPGSGLSGISVNAYNPMEGYSNFSSSSTRIRNGDVGMSIIFYFLGTSFNYPESSASISNGVYLNEIRLMYTKS